MFSYKKVKEGDTTVHKFTIPDNKVSYNSYKKLVSIFTLKPYFGPITPAKRAEIGKLVEDINEKETDPNTLTVRQAISIYHIVMKDVVVKRFKRIIERMDSIVADYKAGASIMELSSKHKYPPCNLLRSILKRNYPDKILREIFVDSKDPTGILSQRDLREFKTAVDNDADVIFKQRIIEKTAQDNEDIFVQYFKSLGIEIKTQNDLVESQTIEHGRAVITPDLLFIDIVFINGVRVHWIDFKSYMLTDSHLIYHSNLKQAEKYSHNWGIGAVCYQFGLVEGIALNGAIPINGSEFPVKFDYNLYG